jgi:hypothetical protein
MRFYVKARGHKRAALFPPTTGRASEPEALIAWFRGLGFGLERIGLEAGPMSQALCGDASDTPCS